MHVEKPGKTTVTVSESMDRSVERHILKAHSRQSHPLYYNGFTIPPDRTYIHPTSVLACTYARAIKQILMQIQCHISAHKQIFIARWVEKSPGMKKRFTWVKLAKPDQNIDIVHRPTARIWIIGQ